jgi:hypothetical protein
MTCRLFIVPAVLLGIPPRESWKAKYFQDGQLVLDPPASAMDYGGEAVRLVAAEVTAEQVTWLSAQSDVLVLPADLSATLTSGQVTAARAALEGLNIPGNWITTSMTWETVLRAVAGLFQFAQKLQSVTGGRRLWRGGALTTRWNQLPVELQQDILDTCAALGYDTAFIVGTTTLRVLLRNLGQQWGSKPLLLGCMTI